jgi:hypothetical protein
MRVLPAMFTFRRNVLAGHAPSEPADLGTAFGLDACLDDMDPSTLMPPETDDQARRDEPPLAWLTRRR